jgi:hypothetical protein
MEDTMTKDTGVTPEPDTLWGVGEIADFLGCPVRRAYYLIERGKLPVRKLSHRIIIASRAELSRLAEVA